MRKKHKLLNYLKTNRLRSGLTQTRMAYLLNCRSRYEISRYERNARVPRFRTLLGYELLFGQSLIHLYAGVAMTIGRGLGKRSRSLMNEIVKEPWSKLNEMQMEFLKATYERLS